MSDVRKHEDECGISTLPPEPIVAVDNLRPNLESGGLVRTHEIGIERTTLLIKK